MAEFYEAPADSLATEVQARITNGEQDLQGYRSKWIEYYKLYRNWREDKASVGRYNEGIAAAFEWVEVMRSRLFDRFCARRPYIRTKGREPSDDYPARGVQAYMAWQLDAANYKRMVYNILTQILVYGTGILKVPWKYVVEPREVMTPIFPELPQAGMVPMERDVVVYDNVYFEVVDIFDFVVDPEATNIEEARWLAHKTRKTMDYIETMGKRGVYNPEIVALLQEEINQRKDGGSESNQYKHERANIEGYQANRAGLLKPVDITEYIEDDTIITIANGKHTLREGYNQYREKPYVVGKIIETPHEFWGIGIIENGAPSIRLMEDLLNNAMDNINFGVNKMFVVDELRVDDSEMVSRPGGFIHTMGDVNSAVKELQISDLAPSITNFFILVNEIGKRVTGVVDVQTGQQLKGATATEASMMQQASDKRFDSYIHMFGVTFVVPLCEKIHGMNNRFVTEEKYIRINATPGSPYEMFKVTPDMFGSQMDFIWEAEDREFNNLIAIQQLTQLMTLAQSHPVLMLFLPIIFYKVLERYGMHENEELMQVTQIAKELSKTLVLQLVMSGGMGAGGSGGVSNPAKVAQGEKNTKQSAGKKTSPQHGSVSNVK